MAVQTYDSAFWRWYLVENFPEFEGLERHQRTINNVENVFNSESKESDLIINLEDGKCFDSENQSYTMQEYIALRLQVKRSIVYQELEVEYERWKGTQRVADEKLKYRRNIETYCWEKKQKEDFWVPVSNFDIILESVIEKYNIKKREWERYFEGQLRYLKFGRPVYKDFKFSPSEIHGSNEFSKAVWEKDFLQIFNLNNEEVRALWATIDYFYAPRIVREFNHSGFIEFEKKRYFLAENVLIKFPTEKGKPLELIAESNGAFKVEGNKYLKPPENATHLPKFDLGAKDPKTNLFLKKTHHLLDEETFNRKYEEVEERFCAMLGGDSDFRQWGKLIMAYVFSFFFMDDIYKHFSHILFLYLYGEGNVGKGEIAKRILDFYGINYLDSLNTPKPRNVDTALEQKSSIPVWIDEHRPEGAAGRGKDDIPDQLWNSWFELKQRQTNILKGDSWDTEHKEVKTMPLFCSNFKPRTDHLLSRTLILEYKKSVRGPESHLRWLASEKELLQLLTLSFMKEYNVLNRDVFIWDLSRIRDKLKEEVRRELIKRNDGPIIQDRQIAQFASLLTVHHWMKAGYRREIEFLANQTHEIEREENPTHRKLALEGIEKSLDSWLNVELYEFVKAEIIRTAIIAAQHDPLTDYIETVGTLIQAGRITEKHFNWTKDGHLKMWSKAIWDEYESLKRGTDDMVRRETIDAKLMDLSKTTPDGKPPTLNWSLDGAAPPQRCKGYYIQNAHQMELFSINFKYHQYCTGGPKPTVTGLPSDNDDVLPF